MSVKSLFPAPARLREIPARRVRILRPLWMILLGFALLADISATLYVLRDAYEVQPQFNRWGLDYDVQYDGEVWVGLNSSLPGAAAVPIKSRVVGLNGRKVDPDARLSVIAEGLQGAKGKVLTVDLLQPDGKVLRLQREPVTINYSADAVKERDFRIAARLAIGLAACAALLMCSLLLGLRRPHDPVAMIFAFAFAALAATIDPPLQMWMWLGLSWISDLVSSFWFYLLLIGFATFPDGIFVPRPYRFLLMLGIPLSIFVSLPDVDENLQVFLGIGLLLAMLVGQVRRFRRQPDGIERQQIKWAAFGFVTGVLLVGASFVVLGFIPEEQTLQNPWVNLAALVLFSLGMAALPLGLLIALTRFRLWEADAVITRSAAYAVVTVVVGVVWAASSDLVKLIIEEIIGRESQAGATTVGAVIAAGIFSPTQSLVLGWTRRHFGGPLDQIRNSAKRLKNWGLTEPPSEVATRALSIIDDAVHPMAGAIVMDTATGRELLAVRNAESEQDARLIERLPLADDEGPIGDLLIGRRSDGNRYNRQELEAIREIIPWLADALRVARGRYSRENMMQQRLDEMATRLAQLEGGTAKPA
jgi:voltage-gated potassium channel Kch